MSSIQTHGPGEHAWLTACGRDRANVVRWTNNPEDVTCDQCRAQMTAPSLPVFLLARLDEYEQDIAEVTSTFFDAPMTEAQMWADVEAKRRIVLSADDRLRAAEQDFPEWASEARVEAVVGAANIAEETLRLLALPYADHPDYRAEWKP